MYLKAQAADIFWTDGQMERPTLSRVRDKKKITREKVSYICASRWDAWTFGHEAFKWAGQRVESCYVEAVILAQRSGPREKNELLRHRGERSKAKEWGEAEMKEW